RTPVEPARTATSPGSEAQRAPPAMPAMAPRKRKLIIKTFARIALLRFATDSRSENPASPRKIPSTIRSRSTPATLGLMKTIAQRELRNHSGEILRQAEAGQEFAVTVDSRPVAVLGPYPKRQWVPKAELLRILRSQPADPTFFEDV